VENAQEHKKHRMYVRVKFRGKEHRKYFWDSVWGGEEEALKAAIQ